MKATLANDKLLARDVRPGMTIQTALGHRFEVAQIVPETKGPAGEVLTFVSAKGSRASFKPFGPVAVVG